MDRQTLYFTVANFSAMIKQYTFSKNSNETRRIWGTLAAPVVAYSGKKHKVFLCKFFITGNMYWIHFSRYVQFMSWNMYWSEFIEDLCEKCSTSRELYIQMRKTRTKIGDTERHWRLPSSPIVEKNMCIFYVNWKVSWFTHGSPNPLFYHCNFSRFRK